MTKIGNVEINGIAALAPMAGVADRAFRELCVGFGASYCVGEMASAKGLVLGDRKSDELIMTADAERPMAIQLFGDDPDIMAQATVKALHFSPDIVDINMGCPTPKITGNGTGAALMRKPQLCGEIVRAVSAAAGEVPVTVKLRLGWDADSINFIEVAENCEKAGCKAITLHARTRAQMYAPSADWNRIAELKHAVSVPVIGNGDIFTADDAMRMLEQTGCDMVMVGRGALGNPWLFREINALYEHSAPLPESGIYEKMLVMKKHIDKLVEYKGEYMGMREARKHTAWYLKGFRGAARLRGECAKLCRPEDMNTLIARILQEYNSASDES